MIGKHFDTRHCLKHMDYIHWQMETSIAYLEKVRKSIDSCNTKTQLMNIKPFVQRYFWNWNDVERGMQAFVACNLMEQWENKYNDLVKNETHQSDR